MVRGAAEGRSSCACQGTLNGIPNAEWYVLPGYVEWYVAPPRVVQAARDLSSFTLVHLLLPTANLPSVGFERWATQKVTKLCAHAKFSPPTSTPGGGTLPPEAYLRAGNLSQKFNLIYVMYVKKI